MFTYEYRIYPNKKQEQMFAKTFGCTRFIYNKILDIRIQNYNNKKENKPLSNRLTPAKYKDEFIWLKEVDSLALANAQLHVEKSYKNFFKHGFGKPKFKNKYGKQSYTTNNVSNTIRIENNKIRLPKVGMVNIVLHRPIQGNIKSVTVKKTKTNKYFISILTDFTYKVDKKANNYAIGIDLGIKDFAILSNGSKIQNPKEYRKLENKMKFAQRALSRKVKGSNNRNKAKYKLAKVHEKISNRRKDFLHKLSHKIINENQVIVLEDLQVKNMVKNHKLAKSIADVSWGTFVVYLQYKANVYNREIIKIDKFFPSSKTCSCCGHVLEKLDLSTREWLCPNCKTKHDRDVNASVNILQEGMKIMKGRNCPDSLLIPSSLEDVA